MRLEVDTCSPIKGVDNLRFFPSCAMASRALGKFMLRISDKVEVDSKFKKSLSKI